MTWSGGAFNPENTGGFELAVWAMFCIGLVVEAAVGEWSSQTFVEE
jgi:hypothetical protein